MEEVKKLVERLSGGVDALDNRLWLPTGDLSHVAIDELLIEAAATLERVKRERDELRLAITGGEDAPGHNASLSHETILSVLRDNYSSWRRDAELAWDGETANSWKARALLAEQREAPAEGGASSTPESPEQVVLLDCLEALTTTCEWFGQREGGEPTTNTEAAIFQRVSNVCARLEARFDLSLPTPPKA